MTDRVAPDTRCMFGNGVCKSPTTPFAEDGCPNYWACRGVARLEGRPEDQELYRRSTPGGEEFCAGAQRLRRLMEQHR